MCSSIVRQRGRQKEGKKRKGVRGISFVPKISSPSPSTSEVSIFFVVAATLAKATLKFCSSFSPCPPYLEITIGSLIGAAIQHIFLLPGTLYGEYPLDSSNKSLHFIYKYIISINKPQMFRPVQFLFCDVINRSRTSVIKRTPTNQNIIYIFL